MNLEGAYGAFIYTLIPIAFIVVLGAKALSDLALVDPNSISSPSPARCSRRRRGAQLAYRHHAHRALALSELTRYGPPGAAPDVGRRQFPAGSST